MSDKYLSQNRKFLHDLATPVTTLRLIVNLLQDNLSQAETLDQPPIKTGELVKKAGVELQKIQDLHADFRAELSRRETEETVVPLKTVRSAQKPTTRKPKAAAKKKRV